MNQYEVTAKLWITIDAASDIEAQELSKNIVDEALYAYVRGNGIRVRISKSKVIWVKNTPEGK